MIMFVYFVHYAVVFDVVLGVYTGSVVSFLMIIASVWVSKLGMLLLS